MIITRLCNQIRYILVKIELTNSLSFVHVVDDPQLPNKMADFWKYSPQYTLRRKKLGEGGGGVVKVETEN